MSKLNTFLLVPLAIAAAPAIVGAQYSVIGRAETSVKANGPLPGTSDTLNPGDHFTFPHGPVVYDCQVLPDGSGFLVSPPGAAPYKVPIVNLPVGTPVTHNGKTYILKPKNPSLSVSIYPFVDFAAAGEVPYVQAGKNAYEGGTTSVAAGLVSTDLTFHLGGASALELGGWYLGQDTHPFGGSNLYDGHLRYTLGQWGLQVDYINDQQANGASLMYMLLYDFNGTSLDPLKPSTWAMRLGVGLLTDISDTVGNFPSGTNIGNYTTNVTLSWQASYSITSRLSLVFSTWYARDRVDDLTRFALGLSWRL